MSPAGSNADTHDVPTTPPTRDAATLVVVDRSHPAPRLLMGRRRADHVFLPSKYVFPGGAIDPEDEATPFASDLDSEEAALLAMAAGASFAAAAGARALALAALRETFEETGFLIGRPAPETSATSEPSWRAQIAAGYRPDLARLRFVARAITPPGRPRRFDTRFFLVDALAIAGNLPRSDGELEDVGWYTFAEARVLDLPGITRIVLNDIGDHAETAGNPAPARAVPFYASGAQGFERVLLSRAGNLP